MASGGGWRRTRLLWLATSVAVVVVAVLAWGAFTGREPASDGHRQEPAAEQGSGQESGMARQLTGLQRRDAEDPFAMGREDAPVVLIQYEDYRCPFCSKFTTDIEPRLIERYVETGVLRIEWRDFPIFGEESVEMAKAGRAAARQGVFWRFHNTAYEMGSDTEKASFPEERIQEVARKAGVPDLDRFNTDRADPEIMEEVRADMAEGQQLGVPSTPAFIINTQPFLGAQPLEQFVSVIEEERAKA